MLSSRPLPPSATLAVCALAAALSGCALLPGRDTTDGLFGVITPYRMEIVQGNAITKELAGQVKPGMSRLQVRDILGTPALADVFHANRWDYVFTIRRQGTPDQRRSVVAWFEGDRLTRLDAADLPSEQEFVTSIARRKIDGKTTDLQLTPAQIEALPRPQRPAGDADAPATPRSSYPPLEAS